MPITVEVPGVGLIDFPDGMAEEDISTALSAEPWKQLQAPRSGGIEGDAVAVSGAQTPRTLPVPPAFRPDAPDLPPFAPTETAPEQEYSPIRQLTEPLLRLPTVAGRELESLKIPELVAGAAFRSPLAVGLARKTEKTSAQVLAGLQQATVGAAEFFTSPLGILTLGAGKLPKLAQRGVALAFVADMARNSPEMVNELAEAFYSNDPERLTRAAGSLGLNTTFIAGGLKAATSRAPRPPPVPEEARQQPTTEVPSAVQISQAETILRDVSEQPRQVVEEVPTPKGPEGIPRGADAPAREVPLTEALPEQPPAAVTEQEVKTTSDQPGALPEWVSAPQQGKVYRQFRILENRFRDGTPAEQKALDLISDNEFGTRRYRPDPTVPEEALTEAYGRLMQEGGLAWSPVLRSATEDLARPPEPTAPKQKFAEVSPNVTSAGYGLVAKAHKAIIQDALREGKPVRPEVLADYPDLAVAPGKPGLGAGAATTAKAAIESPTAPQRPSGDVLQLYQPETQITRQATIPELEAAFKDSTGKAHELSIEGGWLVSRTDGKKVMLGRVAQNETGIVKFSPQPKSGAMFDRIFDDIERKAGRKDLLRKSEYKPVPASELPPGYVVEPPSVIGGGWNVHRTSGGTQVNIAYKYGERMLDAKLDREQAIRFARADSRQMNLKQLVEYVSGTSAEPAAQGKGEPIRMTFQQFLDAPREGKLLDELRKLPRSEKTPEQVAAQTKLDEASAAIDKAGLSWIYDRTDPFKRKMVESALRRLPKTKKKIVDAYESALTAQIKSSGSTEAGQRRLYDRAVKAGIIEDPTPPASAAAGEGGFVNLQFAQVILPKRFIQDVKSAFTKWFKIGGHLPEEAVKLRRQMDARITAVDADVRNAERDLMGALKKEFGLFTAEMLGGGSRKIPPQFVQSMNEYLKGNPAPNLPPEIRGVLDNMRAQITGWSDRITDMFQQQLNQLVPGTPKYESLAKLIETIENNRDIYVHRAYKFFDSKSPAPAWYDDLPLADRMRAEDFVRNNSPTPLTPEQARSKLLDWLSDLRDEGTVGGGAKVGAKDLSIFMKRKVIAPEVRAVLGEYNSPLINYAKSVSKMARWAANQKFLEEVRRAGMGQFLFEEGMNPPGFNARIAPEGSDTMSPLSGLRTTQEIADAFKDIHRTPDYGSIARNYLMLNAWTKVAQTALSVMTQSRNLSSRLWMAGMAGHWQVGKAGRSFKAIYQDFAGSDPAWRAYLKDGYEYGAIGDTSRARELREVVKDAALNDVEPSDLYSWSLARAVKKLGYKIPTDIYRLSDEFGNLFGWENEKANVREVHPTWTDAQVKAEAARKVRLIYPTYSEAPKIVQQFRKNILVGPFVNFPYQVWRNMWNAFGLSMSEIKSSNPIERKIGWKRLGSQIGTVAAAYAAQEFAKATLGISTQEEEDFRRFQPPWARNSKWLFLNKDAATGELGAVNLSYVDPYSYATDIVPAILSGIRGGKDPFEIFAESTRETFRPWVSEQMLLKAIVEARNGKTDRGKEIFNPTDSSMEKLSKQAGHVMKSLEPGTVQRAERRIIPAAKGEQPIYGRKLEFGPEIARELTGVSVEKFNFKNGLAFRASEFVKSEDASEDVFRRILSRTQSTSPADMAEAYSEANKRRFQIWKELRGDYLAAIRRGVKDRDAGQLLVNRGVSRAAAAAIRRGVYEPMPITDAMRSRARERNRAIPMTEIRGVSKSYNRKSLDEDREAQR